MTLKSDTKFKEKLACSFKYDMRTFVNFHPSTQKFKIFSAMGYFCPKYMRFEQKKYMSYLSWHWTVMQSLNKPWACGFKNRIGIGRTFIRALKVWKTVYWWALVVNTILCFSKKISEELCVMTQKSGDFNGLLLRKAYKYLDEKVQKSYVSWKWRVMQSLKKNWPLFPKMTWKIWRMLMQE